MYKQTKEHNAVEKYIPTTRHTATLIRFYFITHRRLPTSIYTKPIKETEKGSCDFPSCRLSARLPPSSCLHVHVSLMACVARGRDPRLSDTRQLRDSVHNAEELSRSLSSFHTALFPSSSKKLSLVRLPSTHTNFTLLCPSTTTHFTPRPARFWTRCIRTRQSGEDTPPLPLPLLASDSEGDDDP